jgi:hypothetical protein
MPQTSKTKKRKGATDASAGITHQEFAWLLKFERGGGYSELITACALYSSKVKALAGFSGFMEKHSSFGDDWKNGLDGFGQEEEDDYLGFIYSGDDINDNDDDAQVLITNTDGDSSDPETVFIQKLKMDP